MSLLTTVQRFCERTNINTPNAVLGSTDPQIKQVKALLEEEGTDLAQRAEWEALVNETTWTWAGASGTNTVTLGTACRDLTASFTTSINVGDKVYNTTTGKESKVRDIVDDNNFNVLTIDNGMFTDGDGYVVISNDMSIAALASNGFRYVKNDTIWDRSSRLPVYIIDATDWQQVKATNVTSTPHQARIRGGELLVNPPPTIGDEWAFEYISYNWITDSTGATYKEFFTQDTDLMLLPERVLLAGLRWRWKKEKGLEYAEDFASYERLVNNAISRQGFSGPLSQANRLATAEPKIVIPDGSWNL